jgi:hypothetical protein
MLFLKIFICEVFVIDICDRQFNTLIERGGGTGPMKPGNLEVYQVPIPAAYVGWMMRGRE